MKIEIKLTNKPFIQEIFDEDFFWLLAIVLDAQSVYVRFSANVLRDPIGNIEDPSCFEQIWANSTNHSATLPQEKKLQTC